MSVLTELVKVIFGALRGFGPHPPFLLGVLIVGIGGFWLTKAYWPVVGLAALVLLVYMRLMRGDRLRELRSREKKQKEVLLANKVIRRVYLDRKSVQSELPIGDIKVQDGNMVGDDDAH